MAVSLTPGAISKIWTGKCTCASKDLKPMLQLTYIDCPQTLTEDDNQWRDVVLSDGSFSQFGYIAEEIFISNKLQEGSIVQLTKFRLTEQIYEGEFYRCVNYTMECESLKRFNGFVSFSQLAINSGVVSSLAPEGVIVRGQTKNHFTSQYLKHWASHALV
ncbi:replication protein A 70 kDa DNA-binding subunit A-like protein [Tanacetum coccineum]